MLSFRLNRATSRWWLGRDQFGVMLANTRSIVQAAQLYITDRKVHNDAHAVAQPQLDCAGGHGDDLARQLPD